MPGFWFLTVLVCFLFAGVVSQALPQRFCPVCGMEVTNERNYISVKSGQQFIYTCSPAHAQLVYDHPLSYTTESSPNSTLAALPEEACTPIDPFAECPFCRMEAVNEHPLPFKYGQKLHACVMPEHYTDIFDEPTLKTTFTLFRENTCVGFTGCVWPNVLMASPGDQTCSANPCLVDECCVPALTCSTFEPSICLYPSYRMVANPGSVQCKSAQGCLQSECCFKVQQCSSFPAANCSSGYIRTSDTSKTCAAATCTAKDCCLRRAKCGSFPAATCSATFGMALTSKTSKMCALAVCTTSECCVATCALFSPSACPTGKVRTGFLGKKCAGGACTAGECCIKAPRCSSFPAASCSVLGNMALISRATSKACAASSCTASECCVGVCGGFSMASCPKGRMRTTQLTKVCAKANCTSAECCVTAPRCSSFPSSNCTALGAVRVSAPSSTYCYAKSCSADICCKGTCGGFFKLKDATCPIGTIKTANLRKTCATLLCTTSECCV